MVHEDRVVKKWSNPEYISSVRLLCNSSPLSERGGYSAYDIQYGIHDQPYFVYGHIKSNKGWRDTIQKIQESVLHVREASRQYQQELANKRGAGDKEVNLYQEGDFVLACKRDKMNSMKLMPRRLGPYKVIRQFKSDHSKELQTSNISRESIMKKNFSAKAVKIQRIIYWLM